jgi:hypothetical protein
MLRYLSTTLPMIVLVTAPLGRAAIIDVGFLPSHFGDLDQHNTNCPNLGCGPAAAVNSFVFLQNSDPFLYETKLVPAHGGDPLNPTPTQADEAGVANTLLGAAFMNTMCTTCGTFWGNFVLGKHDYIESRIPDVTTYEVQSQFAWDPTLGGTSTRNVAKPSYVSDSTMPTINFLTQQLTAGEDIEILFGMHYVTVTGIKWDTEDLMGTLSYIDPNDGKPHTSDIAQAAATDPISLDYNGTPSDITVAVAEWPTTSLPEPGNFAVGAASLIVLALLRRRFTC